MRTVCYSLNFGVWEDVQLLFLLFYIDQFPGVGGVSDAGVKVASECGVSCFPQLWAWREEGREGGGGGGVSCHNLFQLEWHNNLCWPLTSDLWGRVQSYYSWLWWQAAGGRGSLRASSDITVCPPGLSWPVTGMSAVRELTGEELPEVVLVGEQSSWGRWGQIPH